MIANVVSGRVDPHADERVIRERLIPTLQRQPGYHNGYWMRQPGSDQVLAVTVWDNEESLRQALTSADVRAATAQSSSMFVDGPNIEVFRVLDRA
jgi:quinol monooxygenase YgiN